MQRNLTFELCVYILFCDICSTSNTNSLRGILSTTARCVSADRWKTDVQRVIPRERCWLPCLMTSRISGISSGPLSLKGKYIFVTFLLYFGTFLHDLRRTKHHQVHCRTEVRCFYPRLEQSLNMTACELGPTLCQVSRPSTVQKSHYPLGNHHASHI